RLPGARRPYGPCAAARRPGERAAAQDGALAFGESLAAVAGAECCRMRGVQAALLPDGRRLHLQHGPIDLVIEAFGAPGEVQAAYAQAVDAFGDVLPALAAELPLLRTALGPDEPRPEGLIARRMVRACWPFREVFITPMAAVAGAVADHVLARMLRGL